jgi:hypothetical protein
VCVVYVRVKSETHTKLLFLTRKEEGIVNADNTEHVFMS